MLEQVSELVKEVKKNEHIENRIKFYYKDDIGLNIAVQKGSINFIREGQFKFYQHLIKSANGEVVYFYQLYSRKRVRVRVWTPTSKKMPTSR